MNDFCLKDQKLVNETKCENLRQKVSTQKKIPEEIKTSATRGKENEPSAGEKEFQQLAAQNGTNLRTWKRLRRDGVVAVHLSDNGSEMGSKQKGTTLLKEVQEEAENRKRSKKENEVVLVGHLLAEHMGLAEVAV